MLHVFDLQNGVLKERDQAPANAIDLEHASWIDVVEAEDDERILLQSIYRAPLPDAEDVEEIEASARYFSDEQGVHVHSLFLYPTKGRHQTTTVAFILQPERLLTLRDSELAEFRLLRLRSRRAGVQAEEPIDIVLSMLEQKVESMADVLEDVHRRLEQVSHMVLEDEDAEMEDAIDQLAKLEDSSGKIRLCLMDTQRSISNLQKLVRADFERRNLCAEIQHDMEALMPHTSFLFEKINFLMDAALGFTNIEQNKIIKIFSIAAVVFLPPTMIASIYGMNFNFMPELHWKYGYPFAIFLMVLSGVAPYVYFKYKKWL